MMAGSSSRVERSLLRGARAVDVAWLVFAAVVVVATVARVWATGSGMVTAGHWAEVAASAVAIALMLVGGSWLTLGAWRRTIWGHRTARRPGTVKDG